MTSANREPAATKPSEEFATFCDAEFERRLNSGEPFDERLYRKAREMVMERLVRLEEAPDS
jgi:hypothetical protein